MQSNNYLLSDTQEDHGGSETDQWLFVYEKEHTNKITQLVVSPSLDRHAISGIVSIISQDTAIIRRGLIHCSEETYNAIRSIDEYNELQLIQALKWYLDTYESDHLDIRDQFSNNQPSGYTKTNTL